MLLVKEAGLSETSEMDYAVCAPSFCHSSEEEFYLKARDWDYLLV